MATVIIGILDFGCILDLHYGSNGKLVFHTVCLHAYKSRTDRDGSAQYFELRRIRRRSGISTFAFHCEVEIILSEFMADFVNALLCRHYERHLMRRDIDLFAAAALFPVFGIAALDFKDVLGLLCRHTAGAGADVPVISIVLRPLFCPGMTERGRYGDYRIAVCVHRRATLGAYPVLGIARSYARRSDCGNISQRVSGLAAVTHDAHVVEHFRTELVERIGNRAVLVCKAESYLVLARVQPDMFHRNVKERLSRASPCGRVLFLIVEFITRYHLGNYDRIGYRLPHAVDIEVIEVAQLILARVPLRPRHGGIVAAPVHVGGAEDHIRITVCRAVYGERYGFLYVGIVIGEFCFEYFIYYRSAAFFRELRPVI